MKLRLWDRETGPAALETVQTQQTAQEPTTAGWWRRWRGWLAAGAVLLVAGTSCQSSASVRHAGLCTVSRATMDLAAATANGQAVGFNEPFWSMVTSAVDTAAKVC